MITVDANYTQLITVTTAGTPVQGPDVSNPSGYPSAGEGGGWLIKADPTNSGNVWIMAHGQTKATKGFPLAVGESMLAQIVNLSSLDFDADTSGSKIRCVKI